MLTSSFKVPDSDLKDEQVLFLSDVVPTAYWSVEHAGVKSGDTVIVLGCGPIGLMAQKFAKLKGAERVIAIDNVEHRLNHAKNSMVLKCIIFLKKIILKITS